MNSKNQPAVVEVTAGIIFNGKKILITQRHFDDDFGGLWEFPGGKTEPGETLEQCLLREIWEELKIRIEIVRQLFWLDQNHNGAALRIHFFLCRFKNGVLKRHGVQDWKWVTWNELGQYEFLASDQVAIERFSELVETTVIASNFDSHQNQK